MPPQASNAAWKPLVVCPHPELAERLRSALEAVGVTAAHFEREYPVNGEIAGLASRHHSNICFLDVASQEDRALLLVSEAAGLMPVVGLNTRKDADLMLRCLRRGVCEFLFEVAAESLSSALEWLSRGRSEQPQRRPGSVYCVIPGKPGMGASTIAVHLAVQMRAGGEGRILLVDADPMAASIGFMLKLKSEFHLGDVLRDWKRMDEDLWSRLTVRFSGIDVLLAPETPMPRFLIDRPLAEEICHFWRDRYETVVVDMPDLRTAVESGLCALADQILLVTTNELAALHASRRALEVLDLSAGDHTRLRLIVNRYNPAAGLRREDLKTALQFEPFAVLSNDYQAVQDALLDGKPAGSGSRFHRSIQALCDQLRGRSEPAKKNGSWLRFLHPISRPE